MAGVTRSSGGAWTRFGDSIDAGPAEAKVVDTIPLDSFRSLDYIVVVSNDTEDKARRLHLSILRESAGLKSTVLNKTGSLKFAIDEAVNGTDCELTITNNESFEVNISAAKLVLK